MADDEPGIRSFIGRALAAAGYLTDFAATGSEALQRALASHYGLVILDLVMPDMTGQAVLEGMLAAHPDQAVLVLSCLADVASKVDCLERGAQDYLTKPFSLAELLARVRVRLRGADSLADSRTGHERAGEMVRAGGLTLDVGRLVADIGAGPVPLTRLEFLLLRELAEHAGQAVPEGAAAGQRVGLRLRSRLERGRRVRAAAALQTRLRPDQDGTRGGLPACRRLTAPRRATCPGSAGR